MAAGPDEEAQRHLRTAAIVAATPTCSGDVAAMCEYLFRLVAKQGRAKGQLEKLPRYEARGNGLAMTENGPLVYLMDVGDLL